jgi:ParB-like chromosome segregation protein Spo0J
LAAKKRTAPPATELAWPADKVERRSVASLVPYARNPRTHTPAQVDQIAASIREWGWTVPVLVDEQGGLIAGHGRVMAAKLLGLTEIPVMVATGWTEAQKRAYVIADNKLTLNSGWDDELLKVELDDLKALDFDLALMGFSLEEIGALSSDAPADEGGIETPGAGSYKEQYGVIVVCSSETDQAEIYERLKGEGLTVKVVTT